MDIFGWGSPKKIASLETQIASLEAQIEDLKEKLLPEHNTIEVLQQEISQLENNKEELMENIETLSEQCADLEKTISEKEKEIIQLDDEILYQSFALYTPMYNFASSDEYKERLAACREQQKKMLKDKTAVHYSDEWTVNGSKAKGRKMTKDNIKQILRSFNNECENTIDRVKFNNVETSKQRIQKSFDTLNKLNETNRISLSRLYLKLKMDELNLAVEYAIKKQEEKEEQKRIREELREQAKLQKEIEAERKKLDKEKKHYENALAALQEQINNASPEDQADLEQKKQELQEQLEELGVAIQQVDYREANQRAGYVYIISNIGSFGENIYKIGMTRRLDPMDRVNELGDASVPFNFDLHALIFSDDAPGLEAALHHAFDDRKVNMINQRREFFNVTLEEIEEVVKANYDKTVEFVKIPPAEQYRETLMMKQEKSNTANHNK